MIYGDGGRIFRPLALGLDVVGHELTHGVTDHTAQLVYEGQSGALNELYSDVFGALIDDKTGRWARIWSSRHPSQRRSCAAWRTPTRAGKLGFEQPAQRHRAARPTRMSTANLPLSCRADNGGVHINSGIPNHAAFLVAQALDRERTGQIYYSTLTQYLTPNADFSNT